MVRCVCFFFKFYREAQDDVINNNGSILNPVESSRKESEMLEEKVLVRRWPTSKIKEGKLP